MKKNKLYLKKMKKKFVCVFLIKDMFFFNICFLLEKRKQYFYISRDLWDWNSLVLFQSDLKTHVIYVSNIALVPLFITLNAIWISLIKNSSEIHENFIDEKICSFPT